MARSGTDVSSPAGSEGPGVPSPRSKWLIFAIVATALFMASLDMTIIGTALNAIHRSLHAKLNWTGWSVTGFTLGMTITMPVAGRLSDQFGRRRIFIVAAVLFTGSSLACGLASNIYELVGLRAAQAIGGGAFMPSATGIVADTFGENRDRAVAMFTSILPVGGIIGPVLGGVIVTYWSWRGIFFINVPFGILVVILAAKFIPASAPRPGERADLVGVGLLGGFIFALMLGITDFGNGHTGLGSPTVVVPEAIAIVLVVLLRRHLISTPSPIISLRLLRGRGFLSMNVLNTLYGTAVLGMGALVPLYAHDRFGLSTLASGTVLTARAVGTIAVAGVASMMLRKTGYRLPMTVGFSLISIGSVMLFISSPGLPIFWWLAISSAVTGIGMGASMPATNNATLALAPDQVAAIVGLRGMFRQSGAILAVSVMTTITARAADPGHALGYGFVVFAVVLVAAIPLIYKVPEHRGSW
ncbi:MAG TPA: MFS transporter [Acidimicrobiales bacterium]